MADAAWFSDELWASQKGRSEAIVAPELCVEVASMSNSAREMSLKRKLYFEQGAKEFWFCDEYGNISFYDRSGPITGSKLFVNFPEKIEI